MYYYSTTGNKENYIKHNQPSVKSYKIIKGVEEMKKWLLTCSVDGVNIDFETTITSKQEPSFWACQSTAEAHDCNFWSLEQIQEEA